MKNVLFMIPSFSQGGVEHSLVTAIKCLPKERYNISVFVRLNKLEMANELPSNVELLVNKQGHFYRYPYSIFLQVCIKLCLVLGMKRKAKTAEEKLIDFVHRQKIQYPLKNTLKKRRFDVVVSYTIDDCTEMAALIDCSKRYVFYHTPYVDFKIDMMREVMPYFDGIIACGPGVYQELLKGFPTETHKIQLLSNYVDAGEIKRLANATIEDVYDNQSQEHLKLCTCGRLAPQKRFDLAVNAAKSLKERGISFIWVFVGGGDKETEIRQMITNEGLEKEIVMVGNQANPFPYINDCDIYVQTSGFEAQPLTIIEAQKLGKAIVSTDTLGARVILADGERGILTGFTGEDIACGIMKYIENPQKKVRMEHQYSEADDSKERLEYQEKWKRLLS